jgi:hypothetical protein
LYLALADLANSLELYLPTLSLIRDFLEHDISDLNLVDLFENNFDRYLESRKQVLPTLSFITDSLKNYLEKLNNESLPLHAWDVFLFDFTRAYLISKYKMWEVIHANRECAVRDQKPLSQNTYLKKRPYWSIINSKHYIYDFVLEPVRMREKAGFHPGTYHYLILPISHRLANVYKIPRKEIPVYDFEDGISVRDIIRKNSGIVDEDRILRVIKRMIRLELVDVVGEEEAD